jgi:hypothetical protein
MMENVNLNVGVYCDIWGGESGMARIGPVATCGIVGPFD